MGWGRFRWEGVRFGWRGGVLEDNSIKNKHSSIKYDMYTLWYMITK